MKETTPQRFLLTSLDEASNHVDELQMVKPYLCKDFGVVYHATPGLYINRLFLLHVPYRMDNYRIVIFHDADVRAIVNLQQRHVESNMVGLLCPGSIVQIDEVRKLGCVSAIVLSEDYLKLVMGGRMPQALNGSVRDFYLHLSDEEMDAVGYMVMLLRWLVGREDYSQETVASLFAAVLNYVSSLYDREAQQAPRVQSRGQQVFNSFIALVNENGATHHTLDFYADRLCMTERYLGVVVKQQSGVGAKEWIDRAIIADAKVALKHGTESVAQLADRLRFPTSSLFCRYFKRLTGMTPNEYRNQN